MEEGIAHWLADLAIFTTKEEEQMLIRSMLPCHYFSLDLTTLNNTSQIKSKFQ